MLWRQSASVILAIPRLGSARSLHDYEVCLVKRSSKSRVMPDLYVFPGGALDPEDRYSR